MRGRGNAVTRSKWSVGEKNTVYGTHADAGDPRRWWDRQDAVCCGLRINCGRGFRPRIVRSIYFALIGLNCVPGYSRGVAPGCDITTLQAFFVLRASCFSAYSSRLTIVQFAI